MIVNNTPKIDRSLILEIKEYVNEHWSDDVPLSEIIADICAKHKIDPIDVGIILKEDYDLCVKMKMNLDKENLLVKEKKTSISINDII